MRRKRREREFKRSGVHGDGRGFPGPRTSLCTCTCPRRRAARRPPRRRTSFGNFRSVARKISRLPTSTRDVPGSIPARSSRRRSRPRPVPTCAPARARGTSSSTTSTTSRLRRGVSREDAVRRRHDDGVYTSARASSRRAMRKGSVSIQPNDPAPAPGCVTLPVAARGVRKPGRDPWRAATRSPSGRFWARGARRSACWCRRPWRSPPSWSAASSTGTRCAWGRAAAPPGSRTRCSGCRGRSTSPPLRTAVKIESDKIESVFSKTTEKTAFRRTKRTKPRG